jgi:hypothetical protein
LNSTDSKFLERLSQFGYEDVGEWPGLSHFAEQEWLSSMYHSDRAMCARNLLTAAIISGLTQCLLGLIPSDNFWAGAKMGKHSGRPKSGIYLHVWTPDGIPALAWVEDNGMDELTIKVACWPKGRSYSQFGRV